VYTHTVYGIAMRLVLASSAEGGR